MADYADAGDSMSNTAGSFSAPDTTAYVESATAPDTTIVAHHEAVTDADLQPLSEDQITYLVARRKELTDAVWFLDVATETGDILQFVPAVLACGNAVVLGPDDWEDHLGNSYNSWLGVTLEHGTTEQFLRARDQIVHGGMQLAAEVDEWIKENDQTTFTAQGRIALHRLSRTADAAYQYLLVGPGSVAYAADHPDDDSTAGDGYPTDGTDDGSVDYADGGDGYGTGSYGTDSYGYGSDDQSTDESDGERWEDDSEELL
jgi:hypothetical protein